MRRFYNVYSKSVNTVYPISFTLSWSHYLKLMRIDNPDERRFYEIEATNNNWSLRELQRQFDASLYERLALSREKDDIWRFPFFEEEQQGKERADYGTYLLRNLAKELQPEYGSGFSVRQLELSRQFYRTYPIATTVYSQLNWPQYKLLITIDDPDKREYYQLEAVNNAWTKRELERHYGTHVFACRQQHHPCQPVPAPSAHYRTAEA